MSPVVLSLTETLPSSNGWPVSSSIRSTTGTSFSFNLTVEMRWIILLLSAAGSATDGYIPLYPSLSAVMTNAVPLGSTKSIFPSESVVCFSSASNRLINVMLAKDKSVWSSSRTTCARIVMTCATRTGCGIVKIILLTSAEPVGIDKSLSNEGLLFWMASME